MLRETELYLKENIDDKRVIRKWEDIKRILIFLRSEYNEISQQWRESGDAIIITVSDREDTVILRSEDYEKMQVEL